MQEIHVKMVHCSVLLVDFLVIFASFLFHVCLHVPIFTFYMPMCVGIRKCVRIER